MKFIHLIFCKLARDKIDKCSSSNSKINYISFIEYRILPNLLVIPLVIRNLTLPYNWIFVCFYMKFLHSLLFVFCCYVSWCIWIHNYYILSMYYVYLCITTHLFHLIFFILNYLKLLFQPLLSCIYHCYIIIETFNFRLSVWLFICMLFMSSTMLN